MNTPRLALAASLVLGVTFVGAWARQGSADPAAPPPPQPAKPGRPPIYDESADAKRQIADALARASKENRRVLIQWGANWCGWCHLLHGLFQDDPAVRRKLMYEYDVVLVDIGRFDRHMDLAAAYGADLKAAGVPFLTILDADGKVLANRETGSLEAKTPDGRNGHDAAKVIDLLTKHQAPYLSASRVLDDGLARAARDGKRVLLHFGAPWCGWCHRLEDWMARDDVRPILDRDFVDVKIDLDRTIGGKDVLTRYNPGGGGGIPWFAMLDAKGEALTTSNGPKGNIGFPAQPEEIEHFLGMLKIATRSMTPAQLDVIRATLEKK